jgi:glutaredoxin
VPSVVLYTREGCHLCDVARDRIVAVRGRIPFELREVDVDRSDDLIRDYGYRVPVVEIDGEPAFEIEVAEVDLEALVRAR